MKKLEDFSVGDILIRYYSQKEWAIYLVTDKKGEGSKKRGMWKPVVISDMSIEDWKDDARAHHDMHFFDYSSRSVENGTIVKLNENLKDPAIRAVAHRSIRKILEGNA